MKIGTKIRIAETEQKINDLEDRIMKTENNNDRTN